MLVLLLVAAWGLLWLSVAKFGRILGFAPLSKRASLAIAFGLCQLLTVIITEIASMGRHLTATTVSVAWLLVALLAIFVLFPHLIGLVKGLTKTDVAAWRGRVRSLSVDQFATGGLLCIMLALLAVTAWLYRPKNADAMAYHLARVEHWIQNESVGPYPAHFLAQIELAPLSSYQFTTLHLLSESDRWDAYVELSAAVICVLGASELARRLGLSGTGQAFTALVVATIPNLLLESTSTTNNLFGAAIGVTAVIVLTAESSTSGWLRRGLAIGVMAGLAELSKGTLFAMLGPVGMVLIAVAVRRSWRTVGAVITLRRAAAAAAAAAIVGGLVCGPFLVRNISLFGSFAGPVTASTIVQHPSLSKSATNIARSVSSQFLIGDGEPVPSALQRFAVSAYRQITELGSQSRNSLAAPIPDPYFADFAVLTRSEDIGANPWHTVLIFATLLMLGFGLVKGGCLSKLPTAIAISLCLGFLAFSATAEWSIYASRYYIVLLVIWAPVVAVALRRSPPTLIRLVAVFLIVACTPQLLDNYSRPLLHPARPASSNLGAYFTGSSDSEIAFAQASADAYTQLTRTIAESNCDRVGVGNWVPVEYPIWVGLRQFNWTGRIQDVNVTNVSRSLDTGFSPCAVITQTTESTDALGYPGMTQMHFGPLTLYIEPAGFVDE